MDWLLSSGFAASRLEAVTLASVLMEENFLRPVGTRSTGAIRSGDLSEQFLDDSTALYTFVSKGLGSSWHGSREKKRPPSVGQGSTVSGERPRARGGGEASPPGGAGVSFPLWELPQPGAGMCW